MADITFTDSLGTVTFHNGLTAVGTGVGSRFRNWIPFQRPIGPLERSLGTGKAYIFSFRTDYGASFTIAEIPNTSLDDALRLIAWLLSGGEVTVNTGDASSRSYATCSLAPDAEPSLTMSSPEELLYQLELTLINTAEAPTAMLCEYNS